MFLSPPFPRRKSPFFTLIAWQQQMCLAVALAKAEDQMSRNGSDHTTIVIRCPQQFYGHILFGVSPRKPCRLRRVCGAACPNNSVEPPKRLSPRPTASPCERSKKHSAQRYHTHRTRLWNGDHLLRKGVIRGTGEPKLEVDTRTATITRSTPRHFIQNLPYCLQKGGRTSGVLTTL
jgi:hypothetical protein